MLPTTNHHHQPSQMEKSVQLGTHLKNYRTSTNLVNMQNNIVCNDDKDFQSRMLGKYALELNEEQVKKNNHEAMEAYKERIKRQCGVKDAALKARIKDAEEKYNKMWNDDKVKPMEVQEHLEKVLVPWVLMQLQQSISKKKGKNVLDTLHDSGYVCLKKVLGNVIPMLLHEEFIVLQNELLLASKVIRCVDKKDITVQISTGTVSHHVDRKK
jgi:hypothetical protein